MAASAPKNYSISEIKSRAFLLQPALTSNFEVYIQAPSEVDGFIKKGGVSGGVEERLLISCSEASLPGSSLATHELNNDVTGITQRSVYRRLYDDRTDFSFYVTVGQGKEYEQIKYFERWIQYISGEQEAPEVSADVTYPHRVAWPDDYKTTIYITKFERTATSKTGFGKENSVNGSYTGQKLEYSFFNAYPISISSMPVSYDSSSLLKCSVSFTYDKYVAKKIAQSSGKAFSDPGQSSATGVPNVSDTSNFWDPKGSFAPSTDFATAANLDLGLNVSGTTAFNIAPSQNNQQPNIGAGTQAELTQINSNIA